MNKKEFIERLIDMGGCGAKPETWERGWDDAISEVLGIAEELDEPQKPVVPQFVADYIEKYKGEEYPLGAWLNFVYIDEFERKTDVWLYSGSYEENRRREYLLIDAIRYGYEVEKEKLYRIKFSGNQYVSRFNDRKINSILTDKESAAQYTEAEIKAIDERYWVFSEEVTE